MQSPLAHEFVDVDASYASSCYILYSNKYGARRSGACISNTNWFLMNIYQRVVCACECASCRQHEKLHFPSWNMWKNGNMPTNTTSQNTHWKQQAISAPCGSINGALRAPKVQGFQTMIMLRVFSVWPRTRLSGGQNKEHTFKHCHMEYSDCVWSSKGNGTQMCFGFHVVGARCATNLNKSILYPIDGPHMATRIPPFHHGRNPATLITPRGYCLLHRVENRARLLHPIWWTTDNT